MIVWRVVQGAGAAFMFPAALAIVVSAYPREERGKAMAAFFGVAGGMTALGPLVGGYLIECSWRAIFWINVPVAIAAVVLTLMSNPDNTKRPAPLDVKGAVLAAVGIGSLVLGLQQASAVGLDEHRHHRLHPDRPGRARAVRPGRAAHRPPVDAGADLLQLARSPPTR